MSEKANLFRVNLYFLDQCVFRSRHRGLGVTFDDVAFKQSGIKFYKESNFPSQFRRLECVLVTNENAISKKKITYCAEGLSRFVTTLWPSLDTTSADFASRFRNHLTYQDAHKGPPARLPSRTREYNFCGYFGGHTISLFRLNFTIKTPIYLIYVPWNIFHVLTEIAIKSKQNRGRNFLRFLNLLWEKRSYVHIYEPRFFPIIPSCGIRKSLPEIGHLSEQIFLHHFFYNLCTLDHLLLNLEPVTLKNESVVAKYLIFCWKCKMAFWLG